MNRVKLFLSCWMLWTLMPIASIAESTDTSTWKQLPQCRLALARPSLNARHSTFEKLRSRTIQNNSAIHLERLGWAYLDSANNGYRSETLYLARQIAGCLDAVDPGSHGALLLQARIAYDNHAFERAEELSRELVRVRGRWFDYAVLGDALLEQGKTDAATSAYQEMVDLKPGPQAYTRIAQLLWATGERNRAMEMMVMAIRATSTRDLPASVWTRSKLAEFLLESGDTSAAVQVANQALALQSNHPPSLVTRALARIEHGDYSHAIADVRLAIAVEALPEYQTLLEKLLDSQAAGTKFSTTSPQPVSPGRETTRFPLSFTSTTSGN